MTKKTEEKGTDWGLWGLLALGAWYFFGRKSNGNGNGNGVTQFRGLEVGYEGVPGSAIEVYPDDTWGGTLRFEHKGAGRTVRVGIGFAVGSGIPYIHNNYFTYIPVEFTVVDHAEWTPCTVPVTRLVGSFGGANYLNQKLDCHRFISNTPVPAGGVASDDYGLNDWDDDVYIVRERIGATTFRELSVEYLGPAGPLTTWSFPGSGVFERSLPGTFVGAVILNNLVNVPSQVSVVWGLDDAGKWISWNRASGAGALQSLVAGKVYSVTTTGACEWVIPTPSGVLSEVRDLVNSYL